MMAQKVQVVLVDDIDGGAATETVSFSLDGATYEIDLSEANAAALREAVAPYLAAGRRVGGRTSRTARGRQSAPRSRASSAAIRDWGRQNGFNVNDRGRISAELRAAYDAAQG